MTSAAARPGPRPSADASRTGRSAGGRAGATRELTSPVYPQPAAAPSGICRSQASGRGATLRSMRAAGSAISREEGTRSAIVYVALGLLAGAAYAALNTQTDAWARGAGGAFGSFHAFVDRGIPVVAGALSGLAFHWAKLRSRLARAEAARADELRSRLRHVERDQAVWVVAAAALHELKNPLHTLGLLVDELAQAAEGDGRGAPATGELAARIRVQMDRTLVPLDALRALARPGRASRDMRSAVTTTREVVRALLPLAAEAGVALEIEAGPEGGALVDAEYLRIILDNLLANAIEGRGDGAARARRVRVTVREEGPEQRVKILVSDDGPGLGEDQAQGLFEPLRTEKSGGLGLGLPIARALARTMGGDLSAAKNEGGFATSFVLELPGRST